MISLPLPFLRTASTVLIQRHLKIKFLVNCTKYYLQCKTQFRKCETNIPRKGTVRLQPYIHAIYIFPRSNCLFCCRKNRWTKRREYIDRPQTHGCGNWDWGRAIPFLDMHKSKFIFSVYRQTPIFRHPFFRKQCFSLKYVLGAPLINFGGMSKFRIYVKMKSSLQF